MNKSWYEKNENLLKKDNSCDIDIPQSLIQKVMELQLLYYVPLPYLIPHPDLLPQESIRYFCVDQNWIGALLDGFCSVGRVKPTDLKIDDSFLTQLYKVSSSKKHTIRKKLLCQPQTDDLLKAHQVTGFLLRSSLVQLYKGLEIQGRDMNNHPLTMLRMEKINNEIMICLFAGELQHITITEPKESVSYGFYDDKKIYLKDLKTGLVTQQTLSLDCDDRKINISHFIDSICHSYNKTELHSAYLAVELLRNQQEGDIYFVRK